MIHRTDTVRQIRWHMQRTVPCNTMFDAVDFGNDFAFGNKYELLVRMAMHIAALIPGSAQARHVQCFAGDEIA